METDLEKEQGVTEWWASNKGGRPELFKIGGGGVAGRLEECANPINPGGKGRRTCGKMVKKSGGNGGMAEATHGS
ncbi:unnamed protein product [Calypogeia fissa]